MYRYKMHYEDGSEAGDAAYATTSIPATSSCSAQAGSSGARRRPHVTRATKPIPDGCAGSDGRYWARTSDPQLVDPPAGIPPRSVRFGLFRRKPSFSEVSAAFEPIDDKRRQTTYR
jgi:hypothetical protein